MDLGSPPRWMGTPEGWARRLGSVGVKAFRIPVVAVAGPAVAVGLVSRLSCPIALASSVVMEMVVGIDLDQVLASESEWACCAAPPRALGR